MHSITHGTDALLFAYSLVLALMLVALARGHAPVRTLLWSPAYALGTMLLAAAFLAILGNSSTVIGITLSAVLGYGVGHLIASRRLS